MPHEHFRLHVKKKILVQLKIKHKSEHYAMCGDIEERRREARGRVGRKFHKL